MMKSLKLVLIGIICGFLISCATRPQPTLNGLVIVNETNYTVFDVKLKVAETGKFVRCSAILSGYECSLGFQTIRNKGHKAILSWSLNGQTFTQELPNQQASEIHLDRPNKAVVRILDDGLLTVTLD